MAGFLNSLPVASQLEGIYVGYFGRAADAGGLAYWEQVYSADIAKGLSVDGTLTAIANSFAVQAETVALYPFLAGGPLTTTDLTTLVNQIYVNLFGATNSGASYWVNQIHSGAVSLGAAVLAIENGAIGIDATVLTDRIEVANTFTSDTAAAGIGTNLAIGSAQTQTFITEARDIVMSIGANGNHTNAELADQINEANAATAAFVANGGTEVVGPGVTFTLTASQDTFNGFGGDTFNAPLVANAFGLQEPTLTVGDSLTEISAGGTLNATFLPLGLIPDLVTGLTIAGLSAWNLSDFGILPLQSVLLTGPNITAPTTLSYTNSLGDMQIGSAPEPVLLSNVLGVGLLSTINVTSDADVAAPLNGYQYLAISMKGSDFSGSDAITVNADAVGFGAPTHGGLPDGSSVLGVIAGPTTGTVGYVNWTLNSSGGVNNNIALGAESATNAATLTINDADPPGVPTTTYVFASSTDGSGPGNWANLTTIDASGTTGQLTITGGETGPTCRPACSPITPRCSSTVIGGSGPDVFDLSASTWAMSATIRARHRSVSINGGGNTSGPKQPVRLQQRRPRPRSGHRCGAQRH